MKKKLKAGTWYCHALKKSVKIMKIFLVLIVLGVGQLQAIDAYSQKAKLSLDFSRARIVQVLDEIENQTSYYFLFNEKLIDLDREVSIHVKDTEIEKILQSLLDGMNVDYQFVDRKIVLSPRETGQQPAAVSGKVTDSSGTPLPGVTVVVKGKTQGTITDANGNYRISGITADAVLVFSFVGMKPREIPVNGKARLEVSLEEETIGLEEVVAVGYGTQKRENIVGAVTSLDGDDIKSVPAASVTQSIAGRLPGVTVRQTNGEPGNLGANILIRGRTTLGGNTGPLIIIDGVQGRSMNEIDPADIASFSVLKDASAAIYGAQAANGVILINTKSGSSGAPRLNYHFYQGYMTPSVIPETTNAAEFATMLSEYQEYVGRTRTYTDEDIELYRSHADPWGHPDTDWYAELIKKWTTSSRHNLTIDGGFRGMTYYVSLGLKNDEAMYKTSSTNYKQYNVRAKLDIPINDWLKTNIDLAAFQTSRIYPYKGQGSIVGQSTRLKPTERAYWPNGLPGPDIEYGDNPVVTSTFAGGKKDQKTYRVQSTYAVTILPPFIKGLSLDARFNYDVNNYYSKEFYQPWILYFPNWDQATVDPQTGFITDMPLSPSLRGLDSPENTENYERTTNKTSNLSLTYAKKIGHHDFSVYAGYEQYSVDRNDFQGFRKYYISTLIQTMDAGGDLNKNTTGGAYIYGRRSLIGRVTYNYEQKYLAEILFRRDGSLKFPPKSRWGNFPGFLLGWRASEENFWKNNLAFIDYFKLRATYGIIGMDPGDPFQYTNKYNLGPGPIFGTAGNIVTIVGPPTVANQNITWETQTSQNIGFDSKFMNNVFHLNVEYFYNKRDHILAQRNASVPDFTGLSLPSENIARVDNQGFEIDGGIHKKINPDFQLDLAGNFSFSRNKVVFTDEPVKAQPWQQTTGHPYGARLMYDAIGVFADQAAVDAYPHWKNAEPGDLIFRDVNGDGEITADDKILIDNVDAPEVFYGITLDASWKNFTLSVLVQGQGKYLRDSNYDDRRGEDGNYFKWEYDNRWTPDNTNTNVPRAFSRSSWYWGNDQNMSTYWLANTAYARLKNVILSYEIPQRFYKKLGVSRATINLSGNNLALLYSATRKFDPEINGEGVYPLMKTFAIGADITF